MKQSLFLSPNFMEYITTREVIVNQSTAFTFVFLQNKWGGAQEKAESMNMF